MSNVGCFILTMIAAMLASAADETVARPALATLRESEHRQSDSG
jgi:hypothetical protein